MIRKYKTDRSNPTDSNIRSISLYSICFFFYFISSLWCDEAEYTVLIAYLYILL